MKKFILLIYLFFSGFYQFVPADGKSAPDSESAPTSARISNLYLRISDTYMNLSGSDELPSWELFQMGMTGLQKMLDRGLVRNPNILTLIDFSKPSVERRLWVIDLVKREVLFHTLVAHGKNSGDDMAYSFSNQVNSHKSSLGFYLTGELYNGKYGLSMTLDGKEPGVNDKARERAIVMHPASYVSENFIQKYGRLGRSFGCPAVPEKYSKEIIEKIEGQSCLFIYYPDVHYLTASRYIDHDQLSMEEGAVNNASYTR